MPSITFTCRSLTPFFLQRVLQEDQMNNPDKLLTPSVFKGPMRFWWRAMMPYCGTQEDREKLRKKEAEIFGGNDGGKMLKSKIKIRTKVISYEWETNFEKKLLENAVFWNSDKKENENKIIKNHNRRDLVYLFFSLKETKENDPRYCFWNLIFEIKLWATDPKELDKAVCAFWLLANFGGVGSRSRRGAGNFKILGYKNNSYSPPLNLNLICWENNWENFSDTVKRNLISVLEFGKAAIPEISSNSLPSDGLTDYCNLHNSDVYILDYKNFEDDSLTALNFLAKNFREIRVGSEEFSFGKEITDLAKEDYFTVKDFLHGRLRTENGKTVEKSVFGLPISYSYQSEETQIPDNKVVIQGWDANRNAEIERSGTGLFLGVISGADNSGFRGHKHSLNNHKNTFFPLVVNFRKKLLPDDGKLLLKDETKNAALRKTLEQLQAPGLKGINIFLDYLPSNCIHPKTKIL